jgi:PAS domain S-box-containing protein
MSIRKKTLAVICLTFLALLGVFFFTARWFLLQDAVDAEQRGTSQDVTRVQAALDDQVAVMDSNVGDWAPWDDTYEFIISADPAYVASNLPNETFANLGVELMLFINNSGQVVYGKMVDLETGAEIPIPDGIYSQVQVGSLLLSHKDPTDQVSGLLSLPEGPMIIASQPIISSLGKGPIRGTLIMGRHLDATEITKLSQRTLLSVSAFNYKAAGLPVDVISAKKSLVGGNPLFVAPQSEKVVSGYTIIKDVYGNPSVILRVDNQRELYSLAKIRVGYLGLSLVVIGVILGLVMIVLLNKMIVLRLTSLTSSVKNISKQGSPSSRVEVNGNDEIYELGTGVNSMLDSIENFRLKERESDERYRQLLDKSPVGIYRTTPDGRILVSNPAFSRMLGFSSSDDLSTLNLETSNSVSGYNRNSFKEQIERDGKITGLESEWHKRDGTTIYIRENARLVLDTNGSPLYYDGTTEDITARKKAELALFESEERFRSLYENATIGMYRTTPDGRILMANPSLVRMLGYHSIDELLLRNLGKEGYEPEYPRHDFQNRIEKEGEITGLESAWKRNDGSTIYVRESARLVRDESGQPQFYEGTVEDITEGRRAGEALRESEEKFRTIAEQMTDVVYLTDDKGFITFVSPVVFALFGFTPAQMQGHFFTDFLAEVDIPKAIAAFKRDVSTGLESKNLVLTMKRKDGSLFTGELNGRFYRNKDIIGTIGLIRDITERVKAEEEIRQLNTKLEQRVEERTRELQETQEQLVRQEKLAVLGQLAGGVGHELRNPLGVINSAIYYLKLVQPDAPLKIKQYHSMIEQEVRNSEKIISDLLDFARIKSVDRIQISVADLVKRTLERFPVPESIKLVLDLPSDLPTVFADPRQMEQVLGNLTVNACQAMTSQSSETTSPGPGQLTISACQLLIGPGDDPHSLGAQDLENGMVAIAVTDTGMGITPGNMKKIFEPLFTTKIKGIGLGLPVSRKLAEANKGRIEVHSEPGKGSTFTLILPSWEITGEEL